MRRRTMKDKQLLAKLDENHLNKQTPKRKRKTHLKSVLFNDLSNQQQLLEAAKRQQGLKPLPHIEHQIQQGPQLVEVVKESIEQKLEQEQQQQQLQQL